MAFQRSFATIHERISRVFKDKRIKPNKINSFLKGLYPRELSSGNFTIVEYSNTVDAIVGMVQFLKEDVEPWEYADEPYIEFVSDTVCKIDLSDMYFSDSTLTITNFKYVSTTTIDLFQLDELAPINGLSFSKYGMHLYMNTAAQILINLITLIYTRRWSSHD